MPIQYINTGTGPNSGDGDSLRAAFNKINYNFTQLNASTTANSIIIVSNLAPTTSTQGTFWYDTVSGRSYIYYDSSWVDSSPSQGADLVDLTTVTSHIIPAADLTYDLGSTSSQWRSLYVGTSTIYLGGTALSVSGGNLTVDGSQVTGSGFATTSTLVNGTYTVALSTTGTLTVPSTIIGHPYELKLAADVYSHSIGRYLRIRSNDLEPSHIHLDTPNNTLYDVILGGDTTYVKVDTTGTVIIGTSGNEQHKWSFKPDGSLTLPPNGHPVYFGPGNAYIQSALGFHIRSDEGVAIDARDVTDPEDPVVRQWYFNPNGVLTFPDATTQTTAYGFVSPPLSSTSTGVAGALAKDATYFYVCTATNAWQRIAWDTNPW